MKTLLDIAKIVRSKNAGPYIITLDIFFKGADDYKSVNESQTFNKNSVSRAYNIKPDQVHSIFYLDDLKAVKINLRRVVPSGHLGDTDVLGAQQHAPLFNISLP